MRVGDVIRVPRPNGPRINVPHMTEIRVLARGSIKVSFFDHLNMGIEVGPRLDIMKIFIFDRRPGKQGDPVGMLLRDETPEGIRFIAAEKFPEVKLKERLEIVQKKLAQMVHDNDFIIISQNLAKIKFQGN